MIEVRRYEETDKKETMAIWNAVVREGIAFPQDEELTDETADAFFMSQSYTGIAVDSEANEIVGLYILHPNNVGRCGHICNTSYAVKEGKRGLHIGEQLVKDSLKTGASFGFRILQFNAVVATNMSRLLMLKTMQGRLICSIT